MKHIYTFLIMIGVLVSLASGDRDDLKYCLRFKVPDQKSVITAPACTLGVDSACKNIEKTEIRVRYFPSNSDTAIVTTIASLYKQPFVKIWDLSNIPNQLTIGIGVIIEVSFMDGDASGLRREGIFLAHQPVNYPPVTQLPYEYPWIKDFPCDTIRFPLSKPGFSAFTQMYWNEKAITVRVNVRDMSFDSSVSQKNLEQAGIEILIDPAKKRRIYPTDDIMRFVVPLSGKPYRVTYQPLFRDGETYQLKQANVRSNFDYGIEEKNNEGFSVTFSIPSYLFGKSLPQEMGYNIIVKTTDKKGKVTVLSLANAGTYNNYSPFLWPSIIILPKPVFKAQWVILLVSFFAGLLIPLCLYFITVLLTKDRPRVIVIKRSEAEKREFEKVKEAIDRYVTQKDLSAAAVAAELNLAPKQLGKTIKKITGLSFKDYTMYLRTEIVCERLRSSHSSEASIAQSCGFRDIKEMDRYFKRFNHTTPQKYRRVQQITQGQ
jgi:AraC-like DNA-binding protein